MLFSWKEILQRAWVFSGRSARLVNFWKSLVDGKQPNEWKHVFALGTEPKMASDRGMNFRARIISDFCGG